MKSADRQQHRAASVKAGRWLQRLLLQIVRQAQKDTEELTKHPEKATHSLRKRMKKLQALLRLSTPAIPEKSLEALRGQIRKIKSTAGVQRDADALSAVSESLDIASPVKRPRRPSAPQLRTMAVTLSEQIRCLKLDALEWDDIAGRYLKTCRRARKSWKKARHDPSEDVLHEWRKQVKSQYHQSLALHFWLRHEGRLHRIKQLGSALGDCHDLDIFAAKLSEKRNNKKALRKVGSRRKKMTRRIFHRAEKIFSHSLSKTERELSHRLGSDVPSGH